MLLPREAGRVGDVPDWVARAGRTEIHQQRPVARRHAPEGWGVLAVLLSVTCLGTVSNNILNVPLSGITRDFGAPLSQGVLVVSSFVIVLAAAMPLSGWVGDRFGRRRVLTAALGLMAAGLVGAGLAPSLWALVACRAIQGLACAAIPPTVMGMLSSMFRSDRRARVMSAWAAANGAGQAVGPPLGGLLADLFGWRSIFAFLAPVTVLLLVLTLWIAPDEPGRWARLHRSGAITLTLGAALLMTAMVAVPQKAVPLWADLGLFGMGASTIGLFVVVSARYPDPLVRSAVISDTRFLRSAMAAFTQMFCLATVLVAVPLYVIGPLGRSTALTGGLIFTLPATMALLAPPVGLLCERASPRRVLRAGLLTLVGASVALGMFFRERGTSLAALIALLMGIGVGVALVQTPAATGATRSPIGHVGAALGLFNMMRFAGAALGTAWVAIAYPRSAFGLLYGGCAVMAAGGFLLSFAGPDPPTGPERGVASPVSAG